MDILIAAADTQVVRSLQDTLSQAGHRVWVSEQSGEALDHLKTHASIQLLLVTCDPSDPAGSIEICRRIKSEDLGRYVHVLMIRGGGAEGEAVEGVESGVDDCLMRPFGSRELESRIQTGGKIIQLNEKLRRAAELKQLHLKSGREVQRSMIPAHFPEIPSLEIDARFIASAYVSGDLYDIFRLDETHLGAYSIDVSGHGVGAALFSVKLGRRLSNRLRPGGMLKVPVADPPYYRINPPHTVLDLLDLEDMLGKYGRFFTMVYAVVHLDTKQVSFCRAGHNPPLIIHRDGSSTYMYGGGPPLGMGITAAPKESQSITLCPGDSFIMFSDGFNETFASDAAEKYGLEQVRRTLGRTQHLSLGESFEELIADVKTFHGRTDFADDISIIGFRWIED
jgi:sigma-B regulation protein RsbU (phosphoserine phosphatase)